MRQRLMMALVGLVAGVLLVAGAGSLILTRNSARNQATQQLVTEAQSLTSGTSHTQSLAALRVVRRCPPSGRRQVHQGQHAGGGGLGAAVRYLGRRPEREQPSGW